MHGVILSVIMIVNYSDGGQTIQQFQHQFSGPTAIEYCQTAKDNLNSVNNDSIIVFHASCYQD